MKSEVTGGKTQGQLLQHTEYLFYYNNMIATVHQYLYYDFSGTPDDPDEVLITYYPDATKLLATPITVWHSYRGANGKIECDEIFLDGTTLKSFEEEVISRVENDEFTIEMFETNSFILRFRTQKVNPYMRPALTLVLYYFDGVYGVKIDNPHRDFGVALYIVDDESSNSDTSLNTAREAERIQLASFYERIDY